MFNSTYYPTPKHLSRRLESKIKLPKYFGGGSIKALEPSAGSGDIIDAMDRRALEWSAIEIEPDLRSILRGKKIPVIDSDFLSYSGIDKFDLIIMNPPFDNGARHLLKAIDIMYRGQILCILNAETLKNTCTNERRSLGFKLKELGADIEYVQDAFTGLDAKRKTPVEIAIVDIFIDRKVEDDIFKDCTDEAEDHRYADTTENYEVTEGKHVAELVREYNQIIDIGTKTIIEYFKNYRKIGKYITIETMHGEKYSEGDDMTSKMQCHINNLIKNARKKAWRKVLDLKDVQNRLTEAKVNEFHQTLNDRQVMDFTEANIRQFVLNLIHGYKATLREAVVDLFDKFTIRYLYDEKLRTKNIHMFNGWKTNKAYYVNHRIIFPVRASMGNPFFQWGRFNLDYQARRTLQDIDIVMSYFDGMRRDYVSMADALEAAFKDGENKAESTYFKIIVYKKGTIHLTFKDLDILRRFNLEACKGKSWLPEDYGSMRYSDMAPVVQAVVDSFEGEETYNKNLGQTGIKFKDGAGMLEMFKA